MKRKLTFTLFCLMVFLGVHAQEITPNDSTISSKKEMKVGIRLSPSLNFFDYGDLSFAQVASDNKVGFGAGVVFDWKISEYNRARLEPYFEIQNVVNESINPNIDAVTSFNNLVFGLDVIPLVITYGGKIKPQLSFGGFAKYYLTTSQETTFNGNTVSNFEPNTSSLQYGFNYGIGAYIGKRLVEFRYYQSLNDFVESSAVPNSINQVQLILVY
ncbi:PorT family protein [Mongoliibacter ruber]|nr:PorT family protein [Mongoliibacter ruber]